MFHNEQNCGIQLQIAESTYICGFRLQILLIPLTLSGISLELRKPEQLALFACCGIRSKTNVPAKFTLQVLVRGIHGNFVSGIH